MTRKTSAIAAAAAAALLLTGRGRGLLRRVPLARRDPNRLPKGIQEYPPKLVDRRQPHGDVAPASPVDSVEIVEAHYLQEPNGGRP